MLVVGAVGDHGGADPGMGEGYDAEDLDTVSRYSKTGAKLTIAWLVFGILRVDAIFRRVPAHIGHGGVSGRRCVPISWVLTGVLYYTPNLARPTSS